VRSIAFASTEPVEYCNYARRR